MRQARTIPRPSSAAKILQKTLAVIDTAKDSKENRDRRRPFPRLATIAQFSDQPAGKTAPAAQLTMQ
jgi:hypothetical protein